MRLLTLATDGSIRGESGDLIAVVDDGNPLDAHWRIPVSDAPMIVAWTGTLADGLFACEPRNWMGQGATQFGARCDALAPALVADERTLAWRPHARHVLSDHPSALVFMKEHGAPFGLALDPAALFEPSMLDVAEDHLERIFTALGPLASLVLLHDVTVDEAGDTCTPLPFGHGRLPASVLADLVARFVPAGTPVVVQTEADRTSLRHLLD